MHNIRRDVLKKAIEQYQLSILQLTKENNQTVTFLPSGNRCREIEVKTDNNTFLIPVKDIITKQPENILQYQI